MRLFVTTLLVALTVLPTARAEETTPIHLGLTAGVVTSTGIWQPAAGVNVEAGVPIRSSRFSVIGGVGGWTFPSMGTVPSRTELLMSAGMAFTNPITEHWSWAAAASPALAIEQGAVLTTTYRPGVLVAPSFGYSTRRKSLGLTFGTQALVLADGFRLGANAGVVYTFW